MPYKWLRKAKKRVKLENNAFRQGKRKGVI